MLANNYCTQNTLRWVGLGISQDGACTDLFENLNVNSLKGDLPNVITFNPPLFSQWSISLRTRKPAKNPSFRKEKLWGVQELPLFACLTVALILNRTFEQCWPQIFFKRVSMAFETIKGVLTASVFGTNLLHHTPCIHCKGRAGENPI
jgi:hypothetical protein